MNGKQDLFINDQSVKGRFLATLFANIMRIGMSVIAGLVIARGLGPSGYGNFNFLLGSFASITALLDAGTSSAFYTFLSQQKRGSKFFLYYFAWIGIQFAVVLAFICCIFPDTWCNEIWLGHSRGLILMAFIASFMMNKVWETVSHAGESIRATVIVQVYNIIIAGLYLGISLLMFFLHRLTLPNLFSMITLAYFLLAVILAHRLRSSLVTEGEVDLRQTISEFKVYCMPLAVYGIVGFAHRFADLWLLQRFSGAVQQGFYSVGFRFSAICLIATTSMMKVFWKEIAEADKLGDKERLHHLYTKILRGLCFVGAAGACFLIPFSREILVFLLGPEYERRWLCLAIMFLYPIHQSLGQINGTYFQATARTGLYSKIGVIVMLVSIPVTYFVLASGSAPIPGLGLGSVGLALKMVIFQVVGVNVLGFFICRLSGWKFDFLYQFGIIGLLLAVSFAVKAALNWIIGTADVPFHSLVVMGASVPVYILAVGMIVYLFPPLSGLERGQVEDIIHRIKGVLKRK